ncbi:hypothetical protein HPP92_027209 [Vanilla planifolia]|uniref:Nodulation-signaling pathway 2 protein n=1 Tax=Vanilla planifolia TaxID=51239 RepID=A0A835PDN2_VANPL|nr:hypothetical protein HPP92_027209 [Vanilla planifolia]
MEVAMEEDMFTVHFPHSFPAFEMSWEDQSIVMDCFPFFGDDVSVLCGGGSTSSLVGGNSSPDVIFSTETSTKLPLAEEQSSGKVLDTGRGHGYRGPLLLQLVILAAEALAGKHKSRELARVVLIRLQELAIISSASTIERLAVYFADALQSLLDGTGKGSAFGRPSAYDELVALHLIQDMTPFANFGHLTATQAILEAVAGERRVHIVDFDVAEGLHWASLMQALVSNRSGSPPISLRITAVVGSGRGRVSTEKMEETGRRLVLFAASFGLSVSFGLCRLDRNKKFRPESVKLLKGEALVFNCCLYPPHLSRHAAASVKSFLTGASVLGARVVTIVKEERSGSGGTGFVGSFLQEFERYWAMMEAMEDEFREQGRARETVERAILSPSIEAAVRKAYCEEVDDDDEGMENWMAASGFRRVQISGFNACQARLLLGLFNHGYGVEEEGINKLVLRWKTRRLFSAAVWSTTPSPAVGSLTSV